MRIPDTFTVRQEADMDSRAQDMSGILRLFSGLPQCVRMPISHRDLLETLVLLNMRRRCQIDVNYRVNAVPVRAHDEIVDPLSPRNMAILQEWPLPKPKDFEQTRTLGGELAETLPQDLQPVTRQDAFEGGRHHYNPEPTSARTMPELTETKGSQNSSYPTTRQHSKSTEVDSDIVVVDAMEALVSPWAEEPAGRSRFLECFETDPRLSALVPEVNAAKSGSLWYKLPKLSSGRKSSKA
jgi:hypothetical protein